MLLCYLAVQRYNFFRENKIFPQDYLHVTPTDRKKTTQPEQGWAVNFACNTTLVDHHATERTLEVGVVDASALLRMNLNVGL